MPEELDMKDLEVRVARKVAKFIELQRTLVLEFAASGTTETSESSETSETTESSEDSETSETTEDSENVLTAKEFLSRPADHILRVLDLQADEWGPFAQLVSQLSPSIFPTLKD